MSERGEGPGRGIRWLALVLGAAADIGSTYVVSFLLVIVVTFAIAATGGGAGIEEGKIKDVFSSPTGIAANSFLGLLCSVLGGFTAGMLARHDPVRHGFLAGVLSTVVGIALTLSSKSEISLPVWLHVTLGILALGATALGGQLASRVPRKPPRPPVFAAR